MFSLPNLWVYQLVAVFLCALPFLLGYRIQEKVGRIVPFLMYMVFMLVGPDFLFGNFFTYNRFGMVGLPLYYFMFGKLDFAAPIARRLKPSFLYAFGAIYAAIFVGFQAQKSIAFSREASGFDKVLSAMKPDKKVLSLVFDRFSAYYDAPVYLHYPVWYQAEKLGVVDFSFAYFYPQVVRYKTDHKPLADSTFVWYPQLFKYDTFRAEGYDYYVVKSYQDLTAYLFPQGAVSLVVNANGWWLYETNGITPPASTDQ